VEVLMATQKDVTDAMKEWEEATSMKAAVTAALRAAKAFDDLYEESAKNLLARTPRLMDVLSAVQAGRLWEQHEQAKRVVPQQGALI
jgi:hypothetical protein